MQKLLQDKNIGINLKKTRKKCGMTQADVVIKLQLVGRNMSTSNYSQIERGVKTYMLVT